MFCYGGNLLLLLGLFEIEFPLDFDRGFVLVAGIYLWFWYALMVLRVGLEGELDG